MPTYEYLCQKCGQTFEAFQSIRAETFQECPKELCRLPKWGHGKVKRLPGTGAGIIFKGSGFYITDYKNKKPTDKAEGGEKAAPAKTEAKSETKTEAKPAKTAAATT